MGLRRIEVDHNLREAIHYRDLSFPVDIWTDDYNTFVDHTMNCHWHSEFEYGVMLAGELDYYLNGVHLLLQEGDGVFVNSNTMHMARQAKGGGDAVMFTIVFPPSLFTGGVQGSIYQKYFLPVLGKPIHGFKLGKNASHVHIIEGLREIYGLDSGEQGYELRCLALFSRLWQDTLECLAWQSGTLVEGAASHRHEEKAKDILSYIYTHYAENITVDEMARRVGISRSECFRCFKRFTNKKPVEYINEFRLGHAASMLKETDRTVAEIGTACGFSSSSYFGKLFKEKYAMTPLAYRRG